MKIGSVCANVNNQVFLDTKTNPKGNFSPVDRDSFAPKRLLMKSFVNHCEKTASDLPIRGIRKKFFE